MDSADERRLLDGFERAQRMGAEVVRLDDRDVVGAILGFARAHGVEHLLVGGSLRSRWQELWREGPLSRLLRAATDIDVHVVPMGAGAA